MKRFALVVLTTYCLSHVGLGASIAASEGQTVVLPCSLKSLGSSTLIWRHRNTNALKVRGDQILDRAHDRVSPFWDELLTGNLSIRISDVQLSDSGEYECHLQPEGFQSNTQLNVTERKTEEREMEERDTSTVSPGDAAPRLSACGLMLVLCFLFL